MGPGHDGALRRSLGGLSLVHAALAPRHADQTRAGDQTGDGRVRHGKRNRPSPSAAVGRTRTRGSSYDHTGRNRDPAARIEGGRTVGGVSDERLAFSVHRSYSPNESIPSRIFSSSNCSWNWSLDEWTCSASVMNFI